MEPNAFIKEVYSRMSQRHSAEQPSPAWEEFKKDAKVIQSCHQYKSVLPENKDAAIIDIGTGDGWFIAACLSLGYTNVEGADFNTINKGYMKKWSPSLKGLHEIETNIGDFLSKKPGHYDFIHMSHVIEHIPKYSLLWVTDALYYALKVDGTLFLRCPNMEGACPESVLYVTMAHEYAFAGSNLYSLLDLCNFEEIDFVKFRTMNTSIKQVIGKIARVGLEKWMAVKNRLAGVNMGGQYGGELIIKGKRGNRPPLFNEKYR